MTITAASPTFVQFAGNGSATVFAAPMKCFAATDVVVALITLGTYVQQYSGYTVGNIDVNGGFTITFAVAPPTGTTVDVRTQTPQTQTTEFANLGAYLPENSTECFDRLTRALQDVYRQCYQFGIHGPDSEGTQWPALPIASMRALQGLVFDTNGLPTIGTLTSVPLTTSLVGQYLYPTVNGEIGVVANQYPYGCPRRYGAIGNGSANDTTALQNCINSNPGGTYIGFPGDIYCVTNIVFVNGGPSYINGNGSIIRGIATTYTNCAVQWPFNYTTVVNLKVDTYSTIALNNPNPNYGCAVWWYSGVNPVQFNTVLGLFCSSCVRGLVFGAFPGLGPTGGLQSENVLVGYQTEGCANPLYNNSQSGFLFLSNSILYSGHDNWTIPRNYLTARAIEGTANGNTYWHMGELQSADSNTGYAADFTNIYISGVEIETAAPIQVVGGNVSIANSNIINDVDNVPQFYIASGVVADMRFSDCNFSRVPGTGSYSGSPIVDSTVAASTSVVQFTDTRSSEWNWTMMGSTVKLGIGNATFIYRNHRMQKTAQAGSDNNVYVIDNRPTTSFIPQNSLDNMGYTLNGWTLNNSYGGGTTLIVGANTGPNTNYPNAQLVLTATGLSTAQYGDPSSLSTIQNGTTGVANPMIRVKAGDLFWLECWIKIALGSNGSLVANFYSITGAALSTNATIADVGSIGSNTWTHAEGPFFVPAGGAYMAFGVQGNVSTIQMTDLRIRRAS